jgi:hypothetical protein
VLEECPARMLHVTCAARGQRGQHVFLRHADLLATVPGKLLRAWIAYLDDPK